MYIKIKVRVLVMFERIFSYQIFLYFVKSLITNFIAEVFLLLTRLIIYNLKMKSLIN